MIFKKAKVACLRTYHGELIGWVVLYSKLRPRITENGVDFKVI